MDDWYATLADLPGELAEVESVFGLEIERMTDRSGSSIGLDKIQKLESGDSRQVLSLDEAQQTVDAWIQSTGVRYFSELTNLAQLMEEVGELARLVSRIHGDQSFKAGENPDQVPDELADIMFVLICLANQMGVNLNDALLESLNKKTRRDSDRHRNNPKLNPSTENPS